MAAGDYESRYCDDAIAATQQIADLNRVSDRTREYLLDDTHDLRRLQDRPEEKVSGNLALLQASNAIGDWLVSGGNL